MSDPFAPQRGHSWWHRYRAVIVIAVVAVAVGGYGIHHQRANAQHRVVVTLTGTAPSAQVTLRAGTERQFDARTPWETVTYVTGSEPVVVYAQNQAAAGTVRCQISIDGQVVSSGDASTAYGIAACSGVA